MLAGGVTDCGRSSIAMSTPAPSLPNVHCDSTFPIPVENCDEVRGHEPDGLPVVAVDTLDDAEEALAVLAEDGDLSALPTCGDAQD